MLKYGRRRLTDASRLAVRAVRPLPGSRFSWGNITLLTAVVAWVVGGLVMWQSSARELLPDVQQFTAWMAPHRGAWYALPLVVAAYVVLGLVLVPVLLLIAATGIAFGPWVGPIYALAGSLASASVGFGLGRVIGHDRVARLGGRRVARVSHALERNGTLAVFFLRKVPAPFMLSNLIVGASRVRYRDFLLGTILGMAAVIVALAGFGYQMSQVLHSPSPRTLVLAAVVLAVPLTLAWAINRILRKRFDATRAASRR